MSASRSMLCPPRAPRASRHPRQARSRRGALAAWGVVVAGLTVLGGPAGCDAAGGPSPGGGLDVPPGLDSGQADGAHGDAPGGTDTARDGAAGELGPDAAAVGGLGIDWSTEPAGVTPRYEPGGQGWTATPWPTDRLRTADGHVDLSTFPNPSVDLLDTYLSYGEEVLDGFGLNSSIYVELDGAVDLASLPDAALSQSDPLAVAQLVDVTPESPRYGQRWPVKFHFYGQGTDPYYRPNTLAMRPMFGFPLAEGETFCALITRAVRGADGRVLGQAKAFADALAPGGEPTLEPLRAWLPSSPLQAVDVAVATCFTTGRPTGDLRRVRAFLESQPVPAWADVSYEGKASYNYEFQGHYLAPNFEAGDKPYASTGGDFRLDAQGQPIVQEQELIRARVLVPTAYTMPPAGWPVVLYAHGTGGDWGTCTYTVGPELARKGLAVVCIDQPLHGDRAPEGGLTSDELELYSFNFMNPRSGRYLFQQSAVDTMSLTRALAGGGLDMAAADTSFGKPVRFDPGKIAFFGHSQGGISGAIAIGVEPKIKLATLSGAAGVLIQTILLRKDPMDIAAMAGQVMDIDAADLDSFHPAMTLVQTLVDATDPVNYAPYWLNPAPGGVAKHVFVTSGLLDAQSPSVGNEAMCAAGGVPQLKPIAHQSPAHVIAGLPELSLPVVSDITTLAGERRTAAQRQWASGNHWVGLDDADAVALWGTFFQTFAKGQTPMIAL